MLLKLEKLRQEAVSPLGQPAETKAAAGPRDSPLWDPNLGPGICKPAEPLTCPSLGTSEQLSLRPPASRWRPCCLLTMEKSH